MRVAKNLASDATLYQMPLVMMEHVTQIALHNGCYSWVESHYDSPLLQVNPSFLLIFFLPTHNLMLEYAWIFHDQAVFQGFPI